MKINSIIDLVKDLDTSRQTKNLNKLLIRILLHLQVEFSYELFYWGGGKWNSVGRQMAVSDSIVYSGFQGALFYLKNHTAGKDERIFEYKDGKQIFW